VLDREHAHSASNALRWRHTNSAPRSVIAHSTPRPRVVNDRYGNGRTLQRPPVSVFVPFTLGIEVRNAAGRRNAVLYLGIDQRAGDQERMLRARDG
jgi:hypothetical protein